MLIFLCQEPKDDWILLCKSHNGTFCAFKMILPALVTILIEHMYTDLFILNIRVVEVGTLCARILNNFYQQAMRVY